MGVAISVRAIGRDGARVGLGIAVKVRVMERRGYNYRVSDGRSWTTVPRRVDTWPMASARTTAAWVGEGSEFGFGCKRNNFGAPRTQVWVKGQGLGLG